MPYDPDAVYEAVTRDKKTHGDAISIICVDEPGKAEIREVKTASLYALLKGQEQ